MSKKEHPSIRLFESDFMERFTHVHPIIPLLLWGPVVCGLLYHAKIALGLSTWMIGGWSVFGLCSWSVVEYFLHRYVFHFEPRTPTQERFIFILHGLHHADPVDPTRLVMPPLAAIAFAAILSSAFRALFGPIYVFPYFAGFLVGYLAYDYIHYGIHHFTPRTWFGRLVKQHHMSHHYIDAQARFGVSSPLWDYVFSSGKTGRIQNGP